MTTLACAHRLGEDLELLNECHKQGDTFHPMLRSYWNKILSRFSNRPTRERPLCFLLGIWPCVYFVTFLKNLDTKRRASLPTFPPTPKTAPWPATSQLVGRPTSISV
jgi:hypothetical protein